MSSPCWRRGTPKRCASSLTEPNYWDNRSAARQVGNVQRPMLAHPADDCRLIDTDLDPPSWVWISDQNEPAKPVAFPSRSRSHHVINPTNPGGALDDGVEHRLHVRGRAADDAEHLGWLRSDAPALRATRVALLQFLETAARSRWRSRLESAKVSRSLICSSVKGRTSSRRIVDHSDRHSLAQERCGQYRSNAWRSVKLTRSGKSFATTAARSSM